MAKADETTKTTQGASQQPDMGQAQGAAQQPDAPPTTQEKKIPAVFLTNCKHNRELYRAGQRTELPEDVYAELLEAKAIRSVGE